MQIGLVGLGRMGGNMAQRLLRDGHDVVGLRPRSRGIDRTGITWWHGQIAARRTRRGARHTANRVDHGSGRGEHAVYGR